MSPTAVIGFKLGRFLAPTDEFTMGMDDLDRPHHSSTTGDDNRLVLENHHHRWLQQPHYAAGMEEYIDYDEDDAADDDKSFDYDSGLLQRLFRTVGSQPAVQFLLGATVTTTTTNTNTNSTTMAPPLPTNSTAPSNMPETDDDDVADDAVTWPNIVLLEEDYAHPRDEQENGCVFALPFNLTILHSQQFTRMHNSTNNNNNNDVSSLENDSDTESNSESSSDDDDSGYEDNDAFDGDDDEEEEEETDLMDLDDNIMINAAPPLSSNQQQLSYQSSTLVSPFERMVQSYFENTGCETGDDEEMVILGDNDESSSKASLLSQGLSFLDVKTEDGLELDGTSV